MVTSYLLKKYTKISELWQSGRSWHWTIRVLILSYMYLKMFFPFHKLSIKCKLLKMMTKERVREWAIYKKLLVDAANDKLKSKSIIIFFKLQLPTKFSFSNSDQKEKKYFYFCERFFRTYSSVTRCWSKK